MLLKITLQQEIVAIYVLRSEHTILKITLTK
jgi:hypothetical protein